MKYLIVESDGYFGSSVIFFENDLRFLKYFKRSIQTSSSIENDAKPVYQLQLSQ